MLLAIGTMAYGAYLSFNYDTSTASSNINTTETPLAKVKTESTVAGAVLPLDKGESEARKKLLTELAAKTTPKRIIVAIASDKSGDDILAYPDNWTNNTATVVNDKEVLKTLVDEKYVVESADDFKGRDDIQSLIFDIYASFDDAVFDTLIIPANMKQATVQSLAQFLYQGDSEALVIAAADFSEGLPESLAAIHNLNLIQALSAQKIDAIWQSDCTSPGAPLLASEFAKYANQTSLNQLSGQSGQVLAYWDDTSDAPLEKSSSFIIAGDAMFDRNVWHNFKDTGLEKIFGNLPENLFRGTDLSMLNHEGPVSMKAIDDDYKSGSMIFNFPPVVPEVLADLGIKAVSLANNHSSNAGSAGFANTQKVLTAAGIANFGRQTGFDAKEDVIRQDGAVPMSIIGIDALAKYDEKSFLAAIKKEKADGRFVIISPHWGEEYKTVHNVTQKALATKWIDAGAGLIVGSHPHVVQDFEVIKGVPVVYSLGNFVFDQFFSDDTQHGLIMAGTITDKKISLSFLPTKEVVVKPQLLRDAEKKAAIAKVFNIDTAAGFTKISDDSIEISR